MKLIEHSSQRSVICILQSPIIIRPLNMSKQRLQNLYCLTFQSLTQKMRKKDAYVCFCRRVLNNLWWCQWRQIGFFKTFWPQDSTNFCNFPSVIFWRFPLAISNHYSALPGWYKPLKFVWNNILNKRSKSEAKAFVSQPSLLILTNSGDK